MAWLKKDDKFRRNKKVRRAGLSIAVRDRALTWSGDELTDGFVPADDLDFICTGIDNPEDHAAVQVDVGLFELVDGGWMIHNYDVYNPSAEKVKQNKEKDRQRKSRGGRAASKQTPQPIREDSGRNPDGTSSDSETVPNVSTSPEPEPERRAPQAAPTPGSSKRGTRITDDWQPDPAVRTQIAEQYPNVPLGHETEKFIDYFLGVSVQAGTKRDWNATWRNWIRRAAGDGPQARAAPPLRPQGDIGVVPFAPVFEGHDVPDAEADQVDLDELRSKIPESIRNRMTRKGVPINDRATA